MLCAGVATAYAYPVPKQHSCTTVEKDFSLLVSLVQV
jgi:hypothetical protein